MPCAVAYVQSIFKLFNTCLSLIIFIDFNLLLIDKDVLQIRFCVLSLLLAARGARTLGSRGTCFDLFEPVLRLGKTKETLGLRPSDLDISTA